jgi:ubiquinone/menaquinone biosynthesis C-methylase UbiE
MTWKSWSNKLYFFKKWRHQKINPIIRAWWLYLFRVFFYEIQSITVPNKNIYLLDVGCGQGSYLMELIKRKGGIGIGIDPLDSSLNLFKNRIKSSELYHKIEIVKDVGENIPIRENCVSLCIITGTLDHVNDPKLVLKEIYRTLIPKGYLILLETVLLTKTGKGFYNETHVHHFIIADLRNYLRHFKIMKLIRFYPVFSQIHLGLIRKLLDNLLSKVLSFMPGFIGCYLNYSEVLAICRKN